MVQKFINTLGKHKDAILAFYDEMMSSCKVEGVNNRIKTLNKVAYGYRVREFFELKVKESHEARYHFHGRTINELAIRTSFYSSKSSLASEKLLKVDWFL